MIRFLFYLISFGIFSNVFAERHCLIDQFGLPFTNAIIENAATGVSIRANDKGCFEFSTTSLERAWDSTELVDVFTLSGSYFGRKEIKSNTWYVEKSLPVGYYILRRANNDVKHVVNHFMLKQLELKKGSIFKIDGVPIVFQDTSFDSIEVICRNYIINDGFLSDSLSLFLGVDSIRRVLRESQKFTLLYQPCSKELVQLNLLDTKFVLQSKKLVFSPMDSIWRIANIEGDFIYDHTRIWPKANYPGIVVDSLVVDGYVNELGVRDGRKMVVYANGKAQKQGLVSLRTLDSQIVGYIPVQLIHQAKVKDSAYAFGFNYKPVSDSIRVDLPSNVYKIANKFLFVNEGVLSDTADIVVLIQTNTDNAYSEVGGASLYYGKGTTSTERVLNRAKLVSFQRPIYPSAHFSQYAESFIAWIQGLSDLKIKYLTDKSLDDYSALQNKKLLIITGHNEYWSRKARENVDRFVDSGGHLLNLSGNTMWWQVRYDTIGGLVCYKDFGMDPVLDTKYKTILWNSSVLKYPTLNTIGADFDLGGYGLNPDSGWDGFKVVNPNKRIFGDSVRKDDIIKLPTSEYDGAPVILRPDGQVDLNFPQGLFYRSGLLAYDRAFRNEETFGTMQYFQKHNNSGVVISVGSTDWCGKRGISSNTQIKKITKNLIDVLLSARPYPEDN